MKKAILMTLSLVVGTAQASTSFGGFEFHSSIPQGQVDQLVNDFTYLYKNPVTNPDSEFLQTADMAVGDGPNFHNWLLNRAHYIVGESFELSAANLIGKSFRFPRTPLPTIPSAPSQPEPTPTDPQSEKVVVMSNIGAALYIGGKQAQLAIGIKFDGQKVFVTSPRTGLFQVGKGLFLERFLLNKDPKAPANSIFRLGTLAHESRHSDSNSETTGFVHAYCPAGHPFEGYPACDSSSNGPYTIGAMSERHMLKNCTACSVEELKGLEAGVADSLGRVINPELTARSTSLAQLIKSNQTIISSYELMVSIITDKDLIEKYQGEIKKLKDQNASYQLQLDTLKVEVAKAPVVDSTPEGSFSPISLEDSMKLMMKSLR